MQRMAYIKSIQPSMFSSTVDAINLATQLVITIFVVVYKVLEW